MSLVHPEYLISVDELAEDPGSRRILDATVFLHPAPAGGYRAESGRARYEEGHIPGAAFLDLVVAASDTASGLGFTLPEVSQLEALFGSLGIANDTEVVLYSTAQVMWATRAWWLLHYCGHGRARVLDGGFRAWREAGHPVSTEAPAPTPAAFTARPRQERFANRQAVLDAIGDSKVCTVNALSPDVHSGEAEFSYGRKGHIAGSINLFYDDLLDAGLFRDGDALEASLAAKGMLDAERVIAYCGGGIAATVDAFACLLVGQESVAVYDGSMSEWVRDESLPMETGP